MKPVTCRPPPSTRRPRGGGGGGESGDGGSSQDFHGGSGGVASSVRRTLEVDRVTGNPTWMRKLEERYQKLHKKIASIPTSNTAASRFNFLTRKFLNETLAKASRKQSNAKDSARDTNTAPNFSTYKHSLRTEELCEQLSDNDSDSSSEELNDENLPPAEEPIAGGLNGTRKDLVSMPRDGAFTFYTGFCSDFANTTTHPSRRRLVRGASVSLDNLRLAGSARRSPLLERDDALEGNNNMARDLAVPVADLAHISGPPLPPRDNNHTAAGHFSPSASRHRRADGVAGFSGREEHAADGAVRGGRKEDGDSGWVNGGSSMADYTASGLRTLVPISAERNKRGSLLRAAQTGSHYSITTTKSCPAIFNSTEMPSASRRRSAGLRQESTRERNGRQNNMRVFGQMSVEARHAITETLKEMGALKHTDKQRTEETVNEDHNENGHVHSDTSFPSIPEPHTSLPPQRRSKPPTDSSTTQQIRNRSLSARGSKHKSYGTVRHTDATSSVNATVRGGKSPRGTTNKKPPSVSVNGRVRPKSAKTMVTTCADLGSDRVDQAQADVDLLSMASVGNVSSSCSSPELRMHLPAITSRTEPSMVAPMSNNLNHMNYHIRGVGSYRIARERTFEITAPDFDIRYRDVITCQKGDRDTPPPDIFEKSVGKVRDWLNKYFFNS